MTTIHTMIGSGTHSDYATLAKWVLEDLITRGAENRDWDERIQYQISPQFKPEDEGPYLEAKIRVSTHTQGSIAAMPDGVAGDVPGVWFHKHLLTQDKDVAAQRLRLALMRAYKAAKTARRTYDQNMGLTRAMSMMPAR